MVNNFFTVHENVTTTAPHILHLAISWNSRKVFVVALHRSYHSEPRPSQHCQPSRPNKTFISFARFVGMCLTYIFSNCHVFFLQSTIQKLLKQSFIYCHICVFVNHHPKTPPSNQQTKETNKNKKDRFPAPPKKKSSPGTYNGTFFGNFSSRLGAFNSRNGHWAMKKIGPLVVFRGMKS